MKLFRILLFLVLVFGFPPDSPGQNPIVPPGIYMADPTARVWEDGRLYIYGSVDESTEYYCSHRYHVLSSEDMVHWELHLNRFISSGEGDQVPYSDALLFAPDCQARGDSFYLYYCQPDPLHAEGVAVSARPDGPFTDATHIDVGPHNQIDPCLFIDDDGEAYYLWGQFTAKMARMNPDMRSLDLSTLRDSVVTEDEHYFHEGAHMIKRNGIYYLLYAHLGRADMPTCIGYATSRTPMGPFTYGGVIIDNDHCDPGNWNNHGSIMEFNGRWYVFYHRSTHNSRKMRKMCIEPIFFNEDGSIDEVEMTSQGAGPPLSVRSVIPAERACLMHGLVHVEALDENNEMLGGMANGDRAAYKYLDFRDGVDSLRVRVRPGDHSGGIRFMADRPWGTLLARVEVPDDSATTGWMEISAPLESDIEGVHALWLVFDGKGASLFSLDWFQFTYEE